MGTHVSLSFIRLFAAAAAMGSIALLSTARSDGFVSRAERVTSYNDIFNNPVVREDTTLPIKCGLPAISYALSQESSLPAYMRSSLSVVLTRPVMQKSITVGRFRVFYDTTGANTPALLNAFGIRIPGSADAFADSVASIANYVADFETDGSLGYLSPLPVNGTPYDIYIEELGALYGFTTPETPLDTKPDGGTYSTFITIDNDFVFVKPDSNKGLPALRVTLAHEFHHAVQIGKYAYWVNDRYFYEIASVWMEDVVFTDVNDYYEYLRSSQGHFQNPGVPFTSSQLIMYSRGIWGQYVEKRFGREAMRATWDKMVNARPIQAIDLALNSYGSNLRLAFAEWTLWNYFTSGRANPTLYYPEGAFYPVIRQTTNTFTPPSLTAAGSTGPLSSQYFNIVTQQDTLTLALANINIDNQNPNATFSFAYQLNTNRIDDSYKETGSGVFYKLDVPDRTNWYTWEIHKGIVERVTAAGRAFPNPFRADGSRAVYIPVNSISPVTGTITIFSASMDLMYSATENSVTQPGSQAFSWNGRTLNNGIAPTGMYIYVIDLPDQRLTGKIALIRE